MNKLGCNGHVCSLTRVSVNVIHRWFNHVCAGKITTNGKSDPKETDAHKVFEEVIIVKSKRPKQIRLCRICYFSAIECLKC